MNPKFVKAMRNLRLPESIFLVLATVVTMAFLVMIPPGYNPDEPNQFFRAFQIAEGQLLSDHIEHDDYPDMVDRPAEYVGGFLPRSLGQLFADSKTHPIAGPELAGQQRPSDIDWDSLWRNQLNPDDRINIGFSNTAGYSPVVYTPQILAIELGRALNWPVAAMFYAGRLLGAMTAIALSFLAIRNLPVGRWPLMTIALLPTTLTQFAAFSADSLTIALSFLCLTVILKMAFSQAKTRWQDLVYLAVAMLAVALAKPAYVFLLGAVVAIPLLNKYWRKWRMLVPLLSVTIMCSLPALIWRKMTAYVPPSFSTVEKVDTQGDFFLSHPALTFRTLYLTFFTDQGSGRFFYHSFFGSAVWNGVFIPTIFVYLLVVAMTMSLFLVDRREEVFATTLNSGGNRVVRGLFLTLFLIGCILMAYGMYTLWADPQSTVVTGMQGRYFIPFVFLLAYPFLGNSIRSKPPVAVAIILCLVLSQLAMLNATDNFLNAPLLPNVW